MVRKSKNSELGRALARRHQRNVHENKHRTNTTAAQMAAATGRHTTNSDDRGKLQSVLDATDLEELMINVTMANQDFTAERYPGPLAPQTVVVTPYTNAASVPRAERSARRELDKTVLRIPRRPPWDSNTTFEELMNREMEHFLTWRRAIANVEEEHALSRTIGGSMMTPFEKNIEVWRQLWRVVERSDVVLQIVDARDPLLYYCEDLYRYAVGEMGRGHAMVLNKSDLLSSEMITKWEAHFSLRGIDVIFFSAFKASVGEVAADSRILDAPQLIERLGQFERKAPQTQANQRLVIGLCGYPNVGKSSTINVMLETIAARNADDEQFAVSMPQSDSGTETAKEKKVLKRVAVSATPGKTKHFQTLNLTEDVLLCDCPGLVFPNFSSSKAELICAGVLSIDQMRGDYLTPVSLIARRIPAAILEGVYGIRFRETANGLFSEKDASEMAAPGYVSGTVLLDTHARARGYMTDHDRPDGSRSARVLLKDYVNGRLVFAHAPGGGGEGGVGPAVFAKKGRLMYERQEVEKARAALKVEAALNDTGGASSEGRVQQVNFQGDGDLTGSQLRDLEERDGQNQANVSARVSGARKKQGGSQFVRVVRNYT